MPDAHMCLVFFCLPVDPVTCPRSISLKTIEASNRQGNHRHWTAKNSMARRRRHRPLTTSKSSVIPSESPTQSSKPPVELSEMPDQSSQPPSQPELQPLNMQSSMPTNSASLQRTAVRQFLESQPLDALGPTKNRMRTRASTRCLELLKREDEKPHPQVESESLSDTLSTTGTRPPRQWSLESQNLNSTGLTKKRMSTRASAWSSKLPRKEQQLLQLQPVELQSPIPIQCAHQPEFPESQPLDTSGSAKSRDESFLEPLAWEAAQLEPPVVDQESSQPPTQSQPHSVEPQPPTMIHSASQAGFPEGMPPDLTLVYYAGPTKKRKRTRGPTRCLGLLTREDEQPLSVCANEFGQPIGPNSRKLTSFLGTIIRDPKKAPLLWHDWRAMPQRYKDIMWENVQEKFQVGDSLKDWVLMSLATKWRNFKAYLKKKYYDGNVGKDCLVVNDKRVDPAHWQELVRFWDSEKGKLRSSTNKANRSKLHGVHTAGSKSFAMLREELRIKRSDLQNPSQTEVYMLTHTRKDGQPIDNASAAVMAKLSEQVPEQEASECNAPTDEILTQILGEDRHGRVRTFGLGPSPSDVYGPKPTRTQALQMVNEIKKTAEEKLTKMLEQMEAMKTEQEGMKAEQEEMKQKYEDRLAKLQTQLQAVVLLVQGSNMNFQASEQLSLQQDLVSPASSHLLQPPKAILTVGVGSSFPNILRRRKVTSEIPSQ